MIRRRLGLLKVCSGLMLLLIGLLNDSAQAFDPSGFNHAAVIRINGHSGSEVLTSFPVLLNFSTNLPGFSYSQMLSPGAADLRFVWGGTNELNYEIDSWNNAGDSYVWVQLPAFGPAGVEFAAYWGKAGLSKPAYSTNGATWSNGYLGVWHLSQPNAVNSVNGVAGTAHGNVTVPGLVGSAQYFNTNTFNTWLDLGNLRATNLTIEAWTQRANTGEYTNYNTDNVVFRKSGSFQWYQWNVDWNLQLDVTGATTHKFQYNGIFDLPLPAWTYGVVSYDSSSGTGRGYLNAVSRYASTKGANVPVQNNNTCTIGYNSGGTGSYYGNIDEVRLSRVVRSDDWLKACYETQLSPGATMSFEIVPRLSVAPTGPANLVLSWAGTGMVLQASSVLGPGAVWSSTGLPAPVVDHGLNSVTVGCSTSGAAFYRLAFPVKEFTLSAAPVTLNLQQGDFGTSAINLNFLNGFNRPVSFAATNLPSGVAAYFHPVSTFTGTSLTLDVSSGAAPGSYNITVVGTGGALTRTLPLVLNVTPSTVGRSYTWPTYTPNLDYDFRRDYPTITAPSNVLNDCAGVAGTVTSGWWCFRYGPNRNPLVTASAWQPLLDRMNSDFAYFRDVMGWPPDKRAKHGYYSAIYLYGSGLCTDSASNTNLGGWMGAINHQGQSWPMVLLSYYPVYSFDPACTYRDRLGQQGACVHEGIHSILADMPGCRNAGWFHEGGNTWLQGTAAALRSGNYSSMGWLSAGAMIAPFMPIECYSGWLQDDSFGGPSAEGVNRYTNSTQLCTWRNLLGGTQYGEAFPHFMGEIVSQGSVAWIWQYCTNRVLEGLATVDGGLGEFQTRRLIKEYRARQVMCDFGRWTHAYKKLLDDNWGLNIHAEYEPIWINCSNWTATCYVVTTNVANTLTPERRTLPAWSGANQIPLTVSGSGTVSVDFTPLGTNMSCQLIYRATDDSVVYSVPVTSGPCSLSISKPMKTNVVVAVICNTDYLFQGEYSRTNKYDYRITLGTGATNIASIGAKWYN